jgi:hypothetical protein
VFIGARSLAFPLNEFLPVGSGLLCRAIVMLAFRPLDDSEETTTVSKLIALALSSLFAASVAFAQGPAPAAAPAASSCVAKAVSKDGKPLAGAKG